MAKYLKLCRWKIWKALILRECLRAIKSHMICKTIMPFLAKNSLNLSFLTNFQNLLGYKRTITWLLSKMASISTQLISKKNFISTSSSSQTLILTLIAKSLLLKNLNLALSLWFAQAMEVQNRNLSLAMRWFFATGGRPATCSLKC